MAGATFSRVKTWGAEVLTYADLNAEFDNVLTNLTPSGIDDESANDSAAQATSDPYPAAALSKATSLQGEIQQLRYLIKQITGETQWYIDPDLTIAALADHSARHESGGDDAIKLDDLAAAEDNTDLNVSTSAHGLCPKAPNSTTSFLRGDATWAAPIAGLTIAGGPLGSDIETNSTDFTTTGFSQSITIGSSGNVLIFFSATVKFKSGGTGAGFTQFRVNRGSGTEYYYFGSCGLSTSYGGPTCVSGMHIDTTLTGSQTFLVEWKNTGGSSNYTECKPATEGTDHQMLLYLVTW